MQYIKRDKKVTLLNYDDEERRDYFKMTDKK